MCTLALNEDGETIMTPFTDKSALGIRINGIALTGTEPVVLKHNDRIAIGPGSIFLYKNKAKEEG